MASGRTHSRVAYALSVPLTVAGTFVSATVDLFLGIGIVAGAIVGIVVTPDIDHHARTVEEARFYQLGRVPGIVWEWLWYGYALFIPHRGLSHWPIIGTFSRALYAVIMVRVLSWILGGFTADVCGFVQCEPLQFSADFLAMVAVEFWIGLLIGWMIQDFGHLFLDH